MSEEFDRFLREYSSKGKDKIDGYTIVNIRKLRGDERDRALKLLVAEARENPVAIEPIVVLDKDVAKRELLAIDSQATEKELSSKFEILYWLSILTNDPIYANRLVAARQKIPESGVVEYFIKLSEIMQFNFVYDFLQKSIFQEQDETARSVVATAILEKHGIRFEGSTKQEHRRLWSAMVDGSMDEKRAALAELQS